MEYFCHALVCWQPLQSPRPLVQCTLARFGLWYFISWTSALFTEVNIAFLLLNSCISNDSFIPFCSLSSFSCFLSTVKTLRFFLYLHTPFRDQLLPSLTYRISGNFRFVKIFVMEIFNRGNIWKEQPFSKFIYVWLFSLMKITHVKMQEWTKVTYFLEYMPERYLHFLYDALEQALKQGGLFIVAMQRLLKLLVCHARIA